jgi:all-trans-retinol dehydrogenase (NAD+)
MSKGQAFAYQVDLSKREEVYQMAQRVKREVGKVTLQKLQKRYRFHF